MTSAAGTNTEVQQVTPRFLIRQPRALQWFENGRLVKRHDCERQAGEGHCERQLTGAILIHQFFTGRFELFLDLLYVAILSNFADTLAEDISGAKLAKYIVSLTFDNCDRVAA